MSREVTLAICAGLWEEVAPEWHLEEGQRSTDEGSGGGIRVGGNSGQREWQEQRQT